MPSYRLGLFFLFLFLIHKSNGQQQDTVYSDITEALRTPEKVFYLSLDCDENEDSLFYANISKFRNLEVFSISNSSNKKLSSDINALKKLQRIYITSCTDIDFPKLFDQLASISSLKTLSINDCGLEKCPAEIQKLQSLQSLIITDNNEFDTEQLVKQVSKLPKLQKLGLPINQITDLPENIGTLKQIEILDLSNNWLTDLPDEISEMKNLENIDISGNIIISPLSTLGKLKNLNIRYLNMDKGLSVEDKDKLAKLFPSTLITESIKNSLAASDTIVTSIPVIDTTGAIKNINKSDTLSVQKDIIHYGTFNIQKDQFKILSPAYLYYAKLFNRGLLKNTFDSLLFDERYLDTNYVNVKKRVQNNNHAIYLTLKKNSAKEIWFTFYPGIHDEWISKYNYEINAFKGMVWVYTGPLSQRLFKKTYIEKSNSGNNIKLWEKCFGRKGKIYWNDARIYYDQKDMNFTIELKTNNGFKEITTYPRLPDETSKPDLWQKQYTKRYARYLTLLNKRRVKFNKSLFNEKELYDQSKKRSVLLTWDSFRKMYFSDEEKKLSMSEWLEYYDNVIANEKRALSNADASIDNIELYLERENYVNSTNTNIVVSDSSVHAVNSYFKDEEQNLLAVSKIVLINQTDKTYCKYNGSIGLEPMLIYLSSNTSLSIVIELRNGDICVLSKNKYPKENLKGESVFLFTVERINKKLGSVGQIIEILGL